MADGAAQASGGSLRPDRIQLVQPFQRTSIAAELARHSRRPSGLSIRDCCWIISRRLVFMLWNSSTCEWGQAWIVNPGVSQDSVGTPQAQCWRGGPDEPHWICRVEAQCQCPLL